MSGEMLFGPGERQKAEEKRLAEKEDYRNRLHALFMTDSNTDDPLAKDKEFELLIFEGVIMGHVDGDSPQVISVVKSVHNRMGKIEDRERNKKA